ncbi:MAG TPA: GIY-YIG nuclease family protein [Dokdonella sp.]
MDPAEFRQARSRGAFVYVVACRADNRFKIGFSRDPEDRWRTLHRRYFEFFDLERGALVAAARVADARRLERALLDAFAPYQSLAPLEVPLAAAGHTEWFRGALDEAVELAGEHARAHGLDRRRPGDWLREVYGARVDRVFGWSAALFDAVEYERENPCAGTGSAPAVRIERALRDALDAFGSLGFDVRGALRADVAAWYARDGGASA